MKNWMKKILALVLVLGMLMPQLEILAQGTDSAGDQLSDAEFIPPEEEELPGDSDIPEENYVPEGNNSQEDPVNPELEEKEPDASTEQTVPQETTEETVPQESSEPIELLSLLEEATYPGTDEQITDMGNYTLQEYTTVDGEQNTIYWTKGVNPPSMAGQGSHCFYVDVTSPEGLAPSITFQAP